MSVIQVKNTIVYDAIQATDPDAAQVAMGWFHDQFPDSRDVTDIGLEQAADAGLWFVRHSDGSVMLVPADDFVTDFTEVDATAEFAAALAEAPTAIVADDPAERRQAQAMIDAFIAERVGLMLNEFETLLMMAQDEEDSDASEGVQWAYERFKEVFGVEESD